jgi:hypothetical protein
MCGLWLRTWHEDREISPGVPDLSYLMPGNCETGWLELKTGNYVVKPAQIDWIKKHSNRCPVHILLEWKDFWHIIPGAYIQLVAQHCDPVEVAIYNFAREQAREVLPEILTELTSRQRAR